MVKTKKKLNCDIIVNVNMYMLYYGMIYIIKAIGNKYGIQRRTCCIQCDTLQTDMEVVAGGVSAAAACVFTNPMEVVKNRLQVQGELRARGHYTRTYRGPLHGLIVMVK